MKNDQVINIYVTVIGSFYVHWKKHFCLECGTRLKIAYDSIIINSDSPEAECYDFSTVAGDLKLSGDVEFRTSYFKCPNCKFTITFDEMKKIENTHGM